MKLSRVLLTAMLLGTLAMFGCGDDSGGRSASDVCSRCTVQQNDCERAYNLCISEPDPLDECEEVALVACGIIL